MMMKNNDVRINPSPLNTGLQVETTKELPPALAKLAQRAESIDSWQITKKAMFNLSAVGGAVVAGIVDFWMLLNGHVTTDDGKSFAVFVALCALALLTIGLLSFFSLFMSVVSYQRLKLLMEKAEVAEATEETMALIETVEYAVSKISQRERQEEFVRTLRQAQSLRNHPILTERLIHNLGSQKIIVHAN
jgi:hypothetical protein